MKTKVVAMLILGGLPLACVVVPKGGGELVDTGNDEGESEDQGDSDDDGGASATGSGTRGDGDGEAEGGTTEDDDGGTTGGTPLACEEAGWDDSLATFEAGASAMGNSYWYTRVAGGNSTFAKEPCTYETRVEVVDGTIIRRTLSITDTDEGVDPTECISQPYVEEAAEINTNDETYDFVAYTMEEGYAGCCELLAIEPADEYVTGLVLDDNGILSACWANLAGCADDCGAQVGGFRSFTLSSFAWGTVPG